MRFSAKVPGICNAKIQTIVAACNEMGEISRRTFERMLKKANELGLLRVFHTKKSNGKQGHNVYMFNQYANQTESTLGTEISYSPVNGVPKQAKIVAPNESVDLLKTNNIKDNKRTETLSAEFTSDNVPQDFKELASIHFKDAGTIEKLWSKVNMAAYPFCFENDKALKIEVGFVSLRQMIRSINVKNVRDKFGYYYGVLENKFRDKHFEEITEDEFSLVGEVYVFEGEEGVSCL